MSDWELGLVTGPGLIGWLVPISARPRPLPLRQGMEGPIGWLYGWMDCLLTHLENHTHMEELMVLAVP